MLHLQALDTLSLYNHYPDSSRLLSQVRRSDGSRPTRTASCSAAMWRVGWKCCTMIAARASDRQTTSLCRRRLQLPRRGAHQTTCDVYGVASVYLYNYFSKAQPATAAKCVFIVTIPPVHSILMKVKECVRL